MIVTVFTMIGDLIGSRRLPDRAAAHRQLGTTLADVSALLAPDQPFQITVGDEFQGADSDLATLILGGLLVRLRLTDVVDVRCGYGSGEVTMLDAEQTPMVQDGPGWWRARDAINELERRRSARSWYDGPDAARVNAFLLTRDAVVDRLNPRARRLLDGALRGMSQRDLAAQEGISEPAVSQQFARGVGAVRDAHKVFATLDATAEPGGERA